VCCVCVCVLVVVCVFVDSVCVFFGVLFCFGFVSKNEDNGRERGDLKIRNFFRGLPSLPFNFSSITISTMMPSPPIL
jgi:hypothetical protein